VVERVRRREPGDDPDFLDPEQDQRRPDDVEELDGEKEDPQRDRAVDLLGREADAVVPDEHGTPPAVADTDFGAPTRTL
jgi:hypothetical protein